MIDEKLLPDTFNHLYDEISDLIKQKKSDVKNAVNNAMISLYWGIGKSLDGKDYYMDLLFFHRALRRLC